MNVPVYNTAGEEVGQIDLDESVFAVPRHEAVVHQALVAQQANARTGTSSTLRRGEVSGGGKKPWREKGTGRARQGSTRSPQFRGGGSVFGPKPRDWSQTLPRKMRQLAIRSILSSKVEDGLFKVVEQFDFAEPRTKAMVETLANLEVVGPALVVTPEPEQNVILSARNIPRVKTLPATYLNVVDLLSHRALVITVDAVRRVEGWLSTRHAAEAAGTEAAAS